MEYIRRFDRLKDIRADFMAADSTATRLRLLSASVLVSREQLVKRYPQQAHWPTALLQLRRYAGALARVIGLSQRGAAYQLRHAPEKQGPRP
jgi:DNA-binding transcriptional ArsR family regulator